jgi:hypothetical protein
MWSSSANVLREAYMRKLFATMATLAMATQPAWAADSPLRPSYEVKSRADNGVVLAGANITIMNPTGMNPGGVTGGGPPAMMMTPPPPVGPVGGAMLPGGMRAEDADMGGPHAKIPKNPRSRKTPNVR